MTPVIDFSNIKENELIPKGVYPIRFAEFEEKEGDKGPYYTVKLSITDADDEGNIGRSLFTNVSCSEKSLWAFKNFCIALGADKKAFESDDGVDTDEMLESLIGAEGRARVVHKRIPDQDRIVANVAAVLAPGFGK